MPDPILSSNAYIRFDLYLLAIWMVILLYVRSWRPFVHQLFWMGSWGALGGVLVSQWHRHDFWSPPSVLDYQVLGMQITVEDALFGFAFTGIVTLVLPLMLGKYLVAEVRRSVPRSKKILVPVFALLASLLCYRVLGLNSIWSVSAGFFAGASTLFFLRPDLLWAGLFGGFVTVGVYVLTVGAFLVMTPGSAALAQELCQFCVQYGPNVTALALGIWAFTYGLLFVPLYPFAKNLYYADR